MKAVSEKLPEGVKKIFRYLRYFYYYGKKRMCPVCGKSSRLFLHAGIVPRKDAQCIYCGALERHRFLWLFVSKKTNLFDKKPKKMLHIAPEPCFEPRFKKRLGQNYLTADLFDRRAMVKMDITDIQYPDQTFDVIFCSHVLEHVADDKQAMRELFRVLKNSGWAILIVPIISDRTFEDTAVTDPLDRLKIFGQKDHVRSYGQDYIDRLREAGFTVEVTKVSDLVKHPEAVKMGLTPASGEIYYCTK